MATDHARRASTAAAPPPSIPPAPPLPPSRYVARSAFARFAQPLLGYGTKPASAQATRPDRARPNSIASGIAGVTPLSSQDATHKTGLEIKALDISPGGTHAILAGREILKTIRIDGTRCAEDFNLRAAIINYLPSQASGPRTSLDIHDVKWSHSQYKSFVATAASNGRVVLYDLNRAGIEFAQVARFHEHERQVHKIAFNPFSAHLLLSGSQDSTVKLWDLRAMNRDALSCPSRSTFLGQSEIIRDLKWSPTDGVEFAFGTENGTIQRWDYRNPKAPRLKLNAHDRACHSISWHPDGKHLVSASADRTVRVWDFSSDNRRQKPLWQIRAPYPVLNVTWRPPPKAANEDVLGITRCTQVATSYRDHPLVHIWDFRRPFVPMREVRRFNTAPTDLLWKDHHLLWAVTGGREGLFTQTDVHFSPKIMDRRPVQTFAASVLGELTIFAPRRHRRRRSEPSYQSEDEHRDKRGSPEKLSFGKSSAEDSVDDSFLSSSFKKRHGRSASNRSAKSVGSTPPSDDFPKPVSLEDVINNAPVSTVPEQVAFQGPLPGAVNVPIFSYLAQKYKTLPDVSDNPTSLTVADVQRVIEQNAGYAQRASFYRLAQSWRILGHVLSINLLKRLDVYQKTKSEESEPSAMRDTGAATEISKKHSPSVSTRSALRVFTGAEKLRVAAPESSSNVPTPLARPLRTMQEPETNLSLPPSAIEFKPSPIPEESTKNSEIDPDRRRSALGSPHMYGANEDFDERRAKISGWRAHPKAPLNLEQPVSQGIDIAKPPQLGRYNSDESFFMFSASNDSQRGMSIPGSFSSRPAHSQTLDDTSENWEREEQQTSKSHGSGASSGEVSSSRRNSPVDSQESLRFSTNPSQFPFLARERPPQHSYRGSVGSKPLDALKSSSNGALEVRTKIIRDMNVLRLEGDPSQGSTYDSENSSAARKSSPDPSIKINERMQASGTTLPENPSAQLKSPTAATFATPHKKAASNGHSTSPTDQRTQPTSAVTLSDLMTSTSEPDTEETSPFTTIDMLQRLLDFHTTVLSDAQSSTFFLLILAPLLPPTHPLPQSRIDAILSSYSHHFTSLGMPPGEIALILNGDIARVAQAGLSPLHVESILSTYHDQLMALGLFNPAITLRRLAYPSYPAVYEHAIKETSIGLLCRQCNKPIRNGRSNMVCENCNARQALCTICWMQQSPYPGPGKKKHKRDPQHLRNTSATASGPSPSTPAPAPHPSTTNSQPQRRSPPPPSLWTFCALCSHGGHAACLEVWFADPLAEGACPTPGCLCDCAPGRLREQLLQMQGGGGGAVKQSKSVKLDEWKVGESKAVKGVRGALVKGSGGEHSGGGSASGRRVGFVEP